MKITNLKLIQLNYIYLYKKLKDKKFDIELNDINQKTTEVICKEYIYRVVGFALLDKNLKFNSKIENLISKSELDILSIYSNAINDNINTLKKFKAEIEDILNFLDSRLFINKIKKIESKISDIKNIAAYIQSSVSENKDSNYTNNDEIIDFLFN